MGVQRVELDEHSEQDGSGSPLVNSDISLISDVMVKLDIIVGDTEISVGELFNLSKGSVLKMEQDLEEPVMICLDEKIVARGELVAVDDMFGVRITEIAHAKNKVI